MPQPATNTPPRRAREQSHREVRIGSFTRKDEIGRGSFATVFSATHTSSDGVDTLVAIKMVNLGKLNQKLKDNLSSEIKILKHLRHPHIVALIDKKETQSHIYLVMEYCGLGDLSMFIKRRDSLGEREFTSDMIRKYPNPRTGGLNEVVVRHFLKQLSSALMFLRKENLIHRDVKPQNLLLNPSPIFYNSGKAEILPYAANKDSLSPIVGIESLPMLKLADFGFARSLPSTSLAETLCGSPLYMAPEILRYEKYDAKADLWSVGTVLFEMMSARPPFRAGNHVELLRKIEKGEDRIRFPEDVIISPLMKDMIRCLLKRNPNDRISFPEFFASQILIEEIPGLVEEDFSEKKTTPDLNSKRPEPFRKGTAATDDDASINTVRQKAMEAGDRPEVEPLRTANPLDSEQSRRPELLRRRTSQDAVLAQDQINRSLSPTSARRPSIVSHVTAPARQDLLGRGTISTNTGIERQSKQLASPASQLPKEQALAKERERAIRKREQEERENAANDVADERDYVLVEKKAVEVNAFADELAASPQIRRNSQQMQSGAMVRRATVQGTPSSLPVGQSNQSRAVQILGDRGQHHRQSSYDRRLGKSPTSATSAISKALNMASGRLFGVGLSPPVSLGRGGRSPPTTYSPFPAYPTAAPDSVVLVGSTSKQSADDDVKSASSIEECATRSDVVYGFAEVKYRQLIPLAPSARSLRGDRASLGSSQGRERPDSGPDDGLTVEAVVTISEEALVLYVKALSLLARAMDIAGAWWSRNNRGSVFDPNSQRSTQPGTNPAVGNRVNNVVQWVRSRFNDVLEKAEFVRLKLIDSQKRLPADHPSHPSNHAPGVRSNGSMGTSVDQVIVTSGITAEKLMYDRAIEMSRTAAINELTGEDVYGCEIAYVTAVRMLEAVLETEEEQPKRKSGDETEAARGSEDTLINGLEAEDREAVKKMVKSIRNRLAALRKKIAVINKRASAPNMGTSPKQTTSVVPHKTSSPNLAVSPSRQ
ncbi:MAG: hypothetical protein Q9227_000740 [Pyrenula ochraceoflavens]